MFAVPNLDEHRLRCFELTFKAVEEHALARTNAEIGIRFALFHSRQRSDILFAEGAKRIFVECSGEVEIKIAGSIIETFAVEAFDLVVAHLVEVRDFERFDSRVGNVDGRAHRVGESLLRILVRIFQLRAQRSHHIVVGIGIVRRFLEIEVHEFEERTEILRRRAARQSFSVFSEARCERHLFASQLLFQFRRREIAQARRAHHRLHEFSVEHILVGKLVATAPTVGRHENLRVVEVCFLEENTCSVGERPLRVAEGRFGGFDNATCLWQCGYERFALHVVDIGFHLRVAARLHGSFHLVDRGHLHVGLVGIHGEENEIAVVGEIRFTQRFVDGLLIHLPRNELVVVVERGDVGRSRSVEEVAHTPFHIVTVLLLVAVVVERFVGAEEVVACAEQFGAGHPEIFESLHLFHHRRHGFCVAPGFRRDVEREGIFGLREQIGTIVHAGTDERAILLLAHLVQTAVERLPHHGNYIGVDQTEERTAIFLRQHIGFEHDRDRARGLFLVFVDDVDGLCIVGHGIGFVFRCVGRHGHCAENLFHLGFDLRRIDVAHDHHALQVGTIPLLVVGAEEIGFEVVDDRHQTDGKTIAVFAAWIEFGQAALEDAHHRARTHTPFFVNHAAFFVDLFFLEEQSARPVCQNEETRIDVVARHGNIVDVVDRFVGRGVGVQVLTEFHADAFAILDELAVVGEVLRPVESHVLEKVSQTALVVVLLNRSHLLGDVEIDLSFRFGVVPNVVGQPVGEFSLPNGVVGGELGGLLRGTREQHRGKKPDQQKFYLLHNV